MSSKHDFAGNFPSICEDWHKWILIKCIVLLSSSCVFLLSNKFGKQVLKTTYIQERWVCEYHMPYILYLSSVFNAHGPGNEINDWKLKHSMCSSRQYPYLPPQEIPIPSLEGAWILSGTTQYQFPMSCNKKLIEKKPVEKARKIVIL